MPDLTPEEWFEKLDGLFSEVTRPAWEDKRLRPLELKPRNERLDTLWSYYVGDPPLPQVADGYQDTFRDVMRKARCNYAPMCVGAMLDRMELQAVSTQVDRDTNGDDLANQVMEESGFAARFKDILGFTFSMSEAYAMVVPGDPVPTIHAIDPRRCVGIADPNNPVRLRAGLVRDYDPVEDKQFAHLFIPGEKWKLEYKDGKWVRASDAEAVDGLEALGGIPIVRFSNAFGLGEFEPHIDLLDRINDTTLQRIVLTWYQSFRQRAIIGDYDEDEDALTEPVALVSNNADGLTVAMDDEVIFKADPGALWKVPDGFKFWESSQADLTPIITAKRDDVKEFAAVTSTPLHLITPDAANGSAEGAGLMRESATAKVRDRRARVTPPLKLLWRIVFAFAGDANRGTSVKLHWGPIEFRTLAEKGSASAQAKGTLSNEKILTDIWELSPEDAAENIQQVTADQLLAASVQPDVTSSVVAGAA